MKRRILVIDDSRDVRDLLRTVLVRGGFEVVSAADGFEGIAQLNHEPVDLVITDVLMPNQDGVETLLALRKHRPELPVIVISGGHELGPDYYLRVARGLGAAHTLAKPFRIEDLLTCISGCLPKPQEPAGPDGPIQVGAESGTS